MKSRLGWCVGFLCGAIGGVAVVVLVGGVLDLDAWLLVALSVPVGVGFGVATAKQGEKLWRRTDLLWWG